MNEAGEYTSTLETTTGRLEFVSGVANVAIRPGAGADDLYRARFEGTPPEVEVDGGTVTLRYSRRLGLPDLRRRSGEVALNDSIPWRIAITGGLSGLEADLRGLRLDGFEVSGGASGVELTLDEPSGTVPLRIEGGASGVTIRRPEGVAASVVVRGGVSDLALDDQHLGAVGGGMRLESSGYAGAADRYDIVVGSGASRVSVVTA